MLVFELVLRASEYFLTDIISSENIKCGLDHVIMVWGYQEGLIIISLETECLKILNISRINYLRLYEIIYKNAEYLHSLVSFPNFPSPFFALGNCAAGIHTAQTI